MATGATVGEVIAYLLDRLAHYAPTPPDAALARAIHLAEQMATDPDLEAEPLEIDGDDEPSLGWCASGAHGDIRGLDLEDEHDGREPDVDDEPSLGWTADGVIGGDTDLELDAADFETSEH